MAKFRPVPLLIVSLLSACTGGDDAATSTTSTTTTTVALAAVPVASRAEAYFEALATDAAEARVAGSAAPGSDAAIYAEHQATARGLLGGAATRTVAAAGQGFEICDLGAACVAFGAVTSDPVSGLVTSFSIDGVPLAGRIVGGGLVADRDGVIARVTSAYRTNGGDVFVVIEVDNTTEVGVELFGFSAVLQSGPSGAAVETAGVWGTSEIEPAAATDLLLLFPSTEIGGELRFSGLRGDGLDFVLDVRVPSP